MIVVIKDKEVFPLKIEVWSDYVCPFCYIGKRRLEEAIESFPHKDNIQVVFKSFELDPGADRDLKVGIHEKLAAKYNMTIDQAKNSTKEMEKQAKAAGLDFQFDGMVTANTLDAHRLAKYAEVQGKDKEVAELLLKAYFTEAKHIGELDVLLEIAEKAELDRSETSKVLESGQFTEEVRADEQAAQQMSVRGVPFFVLNQKYAISGAQPAAVFQDALKKVWEEEQASPQIQHLSSDQQEVCTEDGCDIPENK
ncbi:putative DsbA family dithiol-disulfide isomerase [Bacillus ectoiniformans]|nr:putative DsbA family dithiol-disulfide isomerase [Bacillus ectoiniformans]